MCTPTNGSDHKLHLSTAVAFLVTTVCLSALSGCGSLAAKGQNAEGVRLFEQARYQEAIDRFERSINNDPTNPDGYYNLAESYHRVGVFQQNETYLAQAEQYYNRCLDHDEDHRHCYRGLAVLLMDQGRRDEAFRLLQGWKDRSPTSPEPKIELARLFEEQGDLQAAKEHLVEAIAVDPENSRALAALGKLREQTGESQLALENYRRSLWYDPFQQGVSARVATLQSSLGSGSFNSALPTPPGGTRTVTRHSSALR